MSQNSLTTSKRNSNLKLLILFLIALGIAILPWFVLAQDCPRQKQRATSFPTIENDIDNLATT